MLRQVKDFLASELASVLYVDEVLDGNGELLYIDIRVSVRGLTETEIADKNYKQLQELQLPPQSEVSNHGEND